MRYQLVVVAVMLTGASAAAKGLTIDDVLAMQRVRDPAVSPDGNQLAFAVRDTDVNANWGRFRVWLAAADGSAVTRLTTSDNDQDPQWSPDGRWIYFSSSRSGSLQVWRIRPGGGEAEQVTKLPIEINGFKMVPDGEHLVIAADVWPDAKSVAASAKRDAERAKSKVVARTYDQLMFRLWDRWEDGKFSHLLVWTALEAGGKADEARDVTPGLMTDVPSYPFGTMAEISVAPDGKTIAFAAPVAACEDAWRTASDAFVVALDGKAPPVDITVDNLADDLGPVFSPDGSAIAIRRLERAGYRGDRQRIAIFDVATRKLRVVTEAWDRSAAVMAWSADGKTIFAEADNLGSRSIFAIDVSTGAAELVVDKGYNTAPRPVGARAAAGSCSAPAPERRPVRPRPTAPCCACSTSVAPLREPERVALLLGGVGPGRGEAGIDAARARRRDGESGRARRGPARIADHSEHGRRDQCPAPRDEVRTHHRKVVAVSEGDLGRP